MTDTVPSWVPELIAGVREIVHESEARILAGVRHELSGLAQSVGRDVGSIVQRLASMEARIDATISDTRKVSGELREHKDLPSWQAHPAE